MASPTIGAQGTVTIDVPGGNQPGEVELSVNGGPCTFIAYSTESIKAGSQIVVLGVRVGSKVDVGALS